jgi:chromosome partitioning protein
VEPEEAEPVEAEETLTAETGEAVAVEPEAAVPAEPESGQQVPEETPGGPEAEGPGVAPSSLSPEPEADDAVHPPVHAATELPEARGPVETPEPVEAEAEEARVEPAVEAGPRPNRGTVRRPSHARSEPTEPAFAERAQAAMERLGELPATNGTPKVRPLPRVVAIANQKGGVGKTTTTVNLGAALSELDYRVLVVDLDPQGNATSGLGIDTRNFESSMYDVIMRDAPIEDCIEPTSVQNLFVTPATIDLAGVEIELVSAFSRELKLKRAIDSVVDDFDFVLIDCPPSLGLLTINGLAAANEVLVPIQCEYYALEGLSQLIRNVQLVASNLNSGLEISAIVLTMFDARTRLAVDVADEVRTHFKEIVCRSIIPRTVRLSEAPSFGQPITVFDPGSRGAVAYRELAKEVSDGAPKRSG